MRLSGPELGHLLGVAFSDQQLTAITAPLEPGLIVAGAGSGKTTVMAARVVWLVASGQVRPGEVLGLTFTNKAAAELGERVSTALRRASGWDRSGLYGLGASEAGEPAIATYHAFAGRLIVEHGLRLGIEPDISLLADASRFCLAAQTIRRAPGPLQHVSTDIPTLVAALLTLDAALSEHLVTPEEVRRFSAALVCELAGVQQSAPVTEALRTVQARDELLTLVGAYRRAKAERGAMDFGDQMALGALIAERCRQVGGIERERYRVALLDEYQDTSVAQRRMLAALFSGPDPAGGRGHPVTAVGDPCQAIYGWRGASVANLEDFPAHFPQADGQPASRCTLSVGRRCAGKILRAANSHAAPMYAAHTGVEPLSAPAETATGGQIEVALHPTYAEEVAWVADAVSRSKAETPARRWSDIGVLVHDNADAAAMGAALVAREVPVEVVGLGGLLGTPEVAQVVTVLEVLHDLTANAALLHLLTGPRWRIGPRDLALLGRQARLLTPSDALGPVDLAAALERAVGVVDPADACSLAEALDNPGELPYSAQARDRFSALSAELRRLRRHSTEPLVDLVRRVVETIGLDVELTASPAVVDTRRCDNLSAFLDAVSTYAASDAEPSLPGLLGYLRAEADYGQGLTAAAPTATDSVKVLTVHKAKGLEWDVVLVPMLVDRVFPSSRGRPRWTSCPAELPWPLRGDAVTLPTVGEWSTKGLAGFRAAAREHDLTEERRLGYVAFTRARRRLVASGHWWGPTQLKPRGPSEYLQTLRRFADEPAIWAPAPAEGATNPALDTARELAWPVEPDPAILAERQAATALVRQAQTRAAAGKGYEDDRALADLTAQERNLVTQWDAELEQLLDEARQSGIAEREVQLPARLSATQLTQLRTDPAGLAREVARPMPRRRSAGARFGSRFHAWVEAYAGGQPLLLPEELPGAADAAIADDAELHRLCDSFRRGPYGDLVPVQVEAPFSLLLVGVVIRGRIDAVYQTANGFQVVDWKTSAAEHADPLQLAIYRLAWAELSGAPLSDVDAVFYHVRSGAIERPPALPGRDELEALVQEVAVA